MLLFNWKPPYLVLNPGSIGIPRENCAFLPASCSPNPGWKADELTVGPAGHYAEFVPTSPPYADKMPSFRGPSRDRTLQWSLAGASVRL